jgi:hypothetical protein
MYIIPLFIVVKEILRGFRNWSEAPTQRIQEGNSFISVNDGLLKPAVPNRIPMSCLHDATEAES